MCKLFLYCSFGEYENFNCLTITVQEIQPGDRQTDGRTSDLVIGSRFSFWVIINNKVQISRYRTKWLILQCQIKNIVHEALRSYNKKSTWREHGAKLPGFIKRFFQWICIWHIYSIIYYFFLSWTYLNIFPGGRGCPGLLGQIFC